VESLDDNAQPPSLGQVLADERERQGLSRVDIAQRLHMSARQVEGLETGDYSRLPKGTFLRGFVRNYAKLLGLDSEALLARLAEAAPLAMAPGIVVPSQNIRFDPLNQRYAGPYMKAGGIAAALLFAGFAALYWWVAVRTAPPAPESVVAPRAASSTPTPQNIAAAPMPAPEPVMPRDAPTEEPARVAPANVDGARPQPASAVSARQQPAMMPAAPRPEGAVRTQTVAATTSVGGDRLRFRFKGASWVEIKDGRGKLVLSKLNPAGSDTEVTGRAPFTVIVGNAPEVEMTFNDRPFALEPHTRVAVARFTVE
jgi:cytoskeleton protein RodZ